MEMALRTLLRPAAAGLAVAAAVLVIVLVSSCGTSDKDAAARGEARTAIAAIDASVARVERAAMDSTSPQAGHARLLRLYLDKWHNTHTAVFAVDRRAAAGRIQTVLDTVAGFSPRLVRTNARGRAIAIDDEAVAQALMPDAHTRAIARGETPRIEHEVDVLADLLAPRPASMTLGGGVRGTVDDVLIRLQARLALLFPQAAQRVFRLRMELPR